jgi:HPt (histidine-containing phosphotransfer) domain-containing protein
MYNFFQPDLLLKLVDDDKDAAVSLIELFIELTPADIELLRKHAQSEDWESVGKIAHKIKSGIITIGLNDLATKIISIERSAKNFTELSLIHEKINEVDANLKNIYLEMQFFINDSNV